MWVSETPTGFVLPVLVPACWFTTFAPQWYVMTLTFVQAGLAALLFVGYGGRWIWYALAVTIIVVD
jgi:hypothetical protein